MRALYANVPDARTKAANIWTQLEQAGAVLSEIIGIYSHPTKPLYVNAGDWATKETMQAIRRVVGADATVEAEASPGDGYTEIPKPKATTKAANYGAHAGETIAGNLARGGDGKFTAAGNASAAAPAKQPAKPSTRHSRAARRARKPKVDPAKREAERKQQQAQRDAERHARQQQMDQERLTRQAQRDQERRQHQAMLDAERRTRQAQQDQERADRQARQDAASERRAAEREARQAARQARRRAAKQPARRAAVQVEQQRTSRAIADSLASRAPGVATTLPAKQPAKQPARTLDALAGGRPAFGQKAAMSNAQRRAMFANLSKSGGHARDSKQVKRARRDVTFARRSLRQVLAKGKPTNEIGKRNVRQARANLRHAETSYTRTYADAVHALNTGRMPYAQKALTVLKDRTGRYRWLTFSSTAFRDRDGEIVSSKALADDVARADRDGQYGTLRWWHTPGLDIGDCDWNAMHGRTLIESGTFRDERYGPLIAAKAADLGVSIGFHHPATEPDGDRVFHRIRRFERSLVPLPYPSNLYTALAVKEIAAVDDMKIAGLKALGFDDATIASIQEQAAAREKAADAAGVAFKADAPPPPADATADPSADGSAADNTVYVGDMSVDDYRAAFVQPIVDAIGALAGATATKAAGEGETATALKATQEQLVATTQTIAQLQAALQVEQGKLETATKAIAELQGDVPAGIKRASQDGATVATKEQVDAFKGPAADPMSDFLGFVTSTPAG
jgi:hypothetical protein